MKTTYLLASILLSSSVFAFKVEFTPAELEKLKKGEQVERIEELEHEVFPRVTVASLIPHSPKENMDVFTDFESQKDYIPGLLKSSIVRHEGNVTDVSFKLHMPMPVSDSEYTTRHTVEQTGNNYYLTWNLVKSDQVKATTGMLIFEEFEGKSLFTYISHITPKSKLAWVVKSKVAPDTVENVAVIKRHLDKVISKK